VEELYNAVLDRGLDLPAGEYTFVVMDEFQDYVDFSCNNSLNDNAFVAKSREFNNISVFAFQSVSSLISRGRQKERIESFINNCNNRIIMYCDDPWTQAISYRHSIVTLTKLGPGEAIALKFNMLLRKHECGLETLQKAHDEFETRLAAAEALGPVYADEIAQKACKAEAEDPAPDYRLQEAVVEWSGKIPPPEKPKTKEELEEEKRQAEEKELEEKLKAMVIKNESEWEIAEALRKSELREPDWTMGRTMDGVRSVGRITHRNDEDD
jgi:hypothetical protein